jgi:hypothetical protein
VAIGVDVRRVVGIAAGVLAAIEVEIGGPAVTGAWKARRRSIWIS